MNLFADESPQRRGSSAPSGRPRRAVRVVVTSLIAVVVGIAPRAQLRVIPLDAEQGHTALGLTLRHLANTGIFMMATAHPDDENNGLFVQLNRGLGYRTTLATATRGNGGQNEIGPEIFEALGVLRTEELAALHRFDGAEQYFTRAVDFGFSFSIDETFEKWGRDEIISDYVRLIRTIRPDVMTAMTPTGNGGGQHHQASAILSREAYKLAGDATKYPEQLKDGLRPWQPKKFYFNVPPPGFGRDAPPPPSPTCRINLASYDALLGKTYSEIGTEARSMHKCQGMAQLLALPGPSVATYQLVESAIPGQMQRAETSVFDGLDSSIGTLAQFAGSKPPRELVDGLAAVSSAVQTAQKTFEGETRQSIAQPLLTGLHAVRTLRARLRAMALDEASRYDVDFRLRQKEAEFQQAVLIASGVRVEALADDGLVVPGQPIKVSVLIANNGSADLEVKQVRVNGFDGESACSLTEVTSAFGGRGARGNAGGGGRGGRGDAEPPSPPVSTLKKGTVAHCDVAAKVPATARVSEPYWHRDGEAGRYTFDDDAPFGLPFRPTPFHAQVTFRVAGDAAQEDVIEGLPVQYRYEGNIFSGEKRTDLLVVPAFSVRVSPEIAIVPVSMLPAVPTVVRTKSRTPARDIREIRVTVVNDQPIAAESVVKLDLPSGWSATPVQQALAFGRQDESQTVRFAVKPPADATLGAYHVRAKVSSPAGQTFDRGYQAIEYPHIRRQHIYHDADVLVKVINVKTAPNLTVGYIAGVGDEVPSALDQLGVKLEYVTAEDLAFGDLSRFNAIVTGVRAYERRLDLRANNNRLLEYVKAGGTLVVQYNKFEFNDAQYGPYPAKVSDNRVTDEAAPISVIAQGDPVVSYPNEITPAAWKGWVQERGLYFLGERDPRYRDLVALEDPFPNNKGEKRGALVDTTYGKGHWVYVGLGLWRQLPAGTDGAYQLLANLISLGKAPAATTAVPRAAPRK
jgi:LmbE family N-acetylglucosaminyl deacetylase